MHPSEWHASLKAVRGAVQIGGFFVTLFWKSGTVVVARMGQECSSVQHTRSQCAVRLWNCLIAVQPLLQALI